MSKYTLHKIPEGFIITSDEEIKTGDIKWHHVTGLRKALVDGNYTNQFKVIAQQHQIDFSLVKDKITDCKFPVNVTGNFENGVFRIQSIIGKEYEIPIVWESYKRYKVEANNLEEAVTKALKQFLSEPDDEYIEDSFSIDDIIYDENPDEDFHIHKIYNSL
jgi:hypothetical protein